MWGKLQKQYILQNSHDKITFLEAIDSTIIHMCNIINHLWNNQSQILSKASQNMEQQHSSKNFFEIYFQRTKISHVTSCEEYFNSNVDQTLTAPGAEMKKGWVSIG